MDAPLATLKHTELSTLLEYGASISLPLRLIFKYFSPLDLNGQRDLNFRNLF